MVVAVARFGDPNTRGTRMRDAAVATGTGGAAGAGAWLGRKHKRFAIPAALLVAGAGQRRVREKVLPPRQTKLSGVRQSRVDWTGMRRQRDFSGLSVRERAAAEAGDWDRWVGRDKATPEKNWNSLMARAKRSGVIGSDTTPGR